MGWSYVMMEAFPLYFDAHKNKLVRFLFVHKNLKIVMSTLAFRARQFAHSTMQLVTPTSCRLAEVLRTGRLQVGAPGSLWSKEEKEAFESDAVELLRKRAADIEGSGAVVERRAKTLVQQPRHASLDVLKMIQAELVSLCRHGLEKWLEQPQAQIGFKPPPYMTWTMDWEQLQWCAGFFCTNKLRTYLELVPDTEHVRNKNLEHAGVYADYSLIIAKAHVCNNARRGPMNTKAWSSLLRSASLTLSRNLHENSEFLLFFWPCIVFSLGKRAEKYSGACGRKQFLADLPALAINVRDPPTSSPQRWMSLQRASEFLDPFIGIDRMLLCFVCMQKGFAKSMSDILRGTKLRAELIADLAEIRKLKALPDDSVVPAEAPAAAAAGAAVPKAKAKIKPSLAKAKAAAKTQVKKGLASAGATLLQVARYRMDDDFVFDVRRYCLVTSAELEAHAYYQSQVHSAESTRAYFAAQAAGAYVGTFVNMMNNMSDLAELVRCGFRCEPSDAVDRVATDTVVLCEDAKGHKMIKHSVGILMYRSASMAWHDSCWPGLSALFVHQDLAIVSSGVALLMLDKNAKDWSEKQGAIGAKYARRSFLNSPVMSQIVRIFENDGGHRAPPSLVSWFERFWSGLMSTVPNERANTILRGTGIGAAHPRLRPASNAGRHCGCRPCQTNTSENDCMWRSSPTPQVISRS